MSLSAKTAEVLRRGDEARAVKGAADLPSWAVRWYQWWSKETNTRVRQENFCHFYRVVFIWAPLLYLRKRTTTWVMIGLAYIAIAIGLLVGTTGVWQGIGITMATIYGAAGLIAGTCLYMSHVNKWKLERTDKVMLLLLVLAIGNIVAGFILAAIVHGLVKVATWVINKLEPYWDAIFIGWIGILCVSLIGLLIFGLISLVASQGWLVTLGVVALVVAVIGAIIGIVALSESRWYEERKRLRRRARDHRADLAAKQTLEPALRWLFSERCPDDADDETAYQAWLSEFEAELTRWYSWSSLLGDIRHGFPYDDIMSYGESQAMAEVLIGHRAKTASKKPARLTISDAGQFFGLLWAYIRTLKWKTCAKVDLLQQAQLDTE